jgi:integral membrane protein
MNGTPKSIFGTFARLEMLTWALLIAAIIARETIGIASNMFFIAGATHGFAFIGYSVTAVLVGVNQRWGSAKTAIAVLLAIVPFATYPFDRSLEKKKQLEGEWRIEASKDPRDNTWFDRTFRWFIFRPVVLVLVLVVFVISLFSFLLWLGPPYQWGN